jgi:hypothetical protein
MDKNKVIGGENGMVWKKRNRLAYGRAGIILTGNDKLV